MATFRPLTFCSLLAVVLLLSLSAHRADKDLRFTKPVLSIDNGLCTPWLQRQLDSVSITGGGTVWLGSFTYPIAGLRLKSKVTLHLPAGCTLLGSTNPDDYPITKVKYNNNGNYDVERYVLFAEDEVHVGITGDGTIDGQGDHPNFKFSPGRAKNRPFLLRLTSCKQVRVHGIRLRRPANWTQLYQNCQDVDINGIDVVAFSNRNNDGLDLDNCRNVRITNCKIDADDDAICLKSSSKDVCEYITISNCVLASNCNVFKTGTGSTGGFRHVTLSNIVMRQASEQSHIWLRQYALAGIALEIVDGGRMEHILVNNVTMEEVMTPIFLRLGNRGTGPDGTKGTMPLGSMEHITITNVNAKTLRPVSSCLMGIPGGLIKHVRLENLHFVLPGAGTVAMAQRTVPEVENQYPENKMFGPSLPASVLYARHVEHLHLRGLTYTLANPDNRPAIMLDDVAHAQLSQLSLQVPDSSAAMVLKDCQNVDLMQLSLSGQKLLAFGFLGQATRNINLGMVVQQCKNLYATDAFVQRKAINVLR